MERKITGSTQANSQQGVLRSSESLAWKNIVIEQRYHAGGEYVFPGSSSHMICLHQGPPIQIEQVRNGRILHHIMARGNLQIVPIGTESIWRHTDGAEHMHVLLAPALLHMVSDDYNQQHIELLDHFSVQDTRIKHISFALLTELLEGGPSGRFYVEGLTTALAAHLIHQYTSTPHDPPEITKGLPPHLLRKITSIIEGRLTDDLGLAELSAEVGLSPSHFSSLFRQTTGLSPHTYIVQRRLERAQHLLTSTRLSIAEIATTVGFYDQSHLTRHMRHILGVTPSYIREHLS